MSSVCFCCQHANPADAKFCNECGSPCSLKPCGQCDAINDAGATECQRCGVDLREAKASAAAQSARPGSPVSSRWEVERAPKTGGRFIADAVGIDHPSSSILTDLTLPPDIADAANVDFLIFPTSQTQRSAPIGQAPLPSFPGTPARREKAFTNRAESSIATAPPRRLGRPMLLALALLSIVCIGGFYGAQYGNRFDESGDRRAQGPMTIGTSPIESPSGPATSNEPVNFMPGADGELMVSANDSFHSVKDPIETEAALAPQRGDGNEIAVHGAAVSAKHVSARVTPQTRGIDNAKPPRSTTAAGRASTAPQKRVSEPLPQRAEGCADSVAALGLCDITRGVK